MFALANGRAAVLGPRAVSGLLALAGFVAVFLVPDLKYPANPPSVGRPGTIGMRTALYVVMMASSVAAMAGAAMLRRHLSARHDTWSSALAAAAFYASCVVVAAAVLPAIDEVPGNFPAVVLWDFRLDSIAMQAIMWTTLGLGFGVLAQRAAPGRSSDRRRVASTR